MEKKRLWEDLIVAFQYLKKGCKTGRQILVGPVAIAQGVWF